MGSLMSVSEAVYSCLILGFILYELLKLCGVEQPYALAMILLYGFLFMFVVDRSVYTPEKGGIFQRLFGYHAIPFPIVVSMVLLALFILYLQGEIGMTVLIVIGALVLLLAYQAVKEINSYRRSGRKIVLPE